MIVGITSKPLACAYRHLALGFMLFVLLTGNGYANNSSCQIEKVFSRYQEAVLTGEKLVKIKRYFTKDLVATIDHYIANVSIEERKMVIDMGYLSAAHAAKHIYRHAGWIQGNKGCLAIDSQSPTTEHRVNLVIEFTKEEGEWRISNDFRATPEEKEQWHFKGIPNHQSSCLRYGWHELIEREVTPSRQNDTRPFIPSCEKVVQAVRDSPKSLHQL